MTKSTVDGAQFTRPDSPKAELIITLEKAWELLNTIDRQKMGALNLELSMLRGVVDHARAVAKRVGQEARAPKAPKAAAS